MRGRGNLLGKGFSRKHDISPGKNGLPANIIFFSKEKMGQVDGS